MKEKENEFQLFLFLSERSSCKECSENVCKVCVNEDSEFYLRKIRRDTIVLIPVEVWVKHRGSARSA
jgi:hypothetical protein